MRVAVIGAPGSGKTTQSQLLAQSLKVPLISLGEELRKLSRGDSAAAIEVGEALGRGELVPPEIVLELLSRRLAGPDCQKGFVLDGMPRTPEEARALSQISPLDRVFHLKVSRPVVRGRLLQRGREDDSPGVIERRFEVYEKENRELLELYRRQGILIEVDATNPSVSEIYREIASRLQ